MSETETDPVEPLEPEQVDAPTEPEPSEDEATEATSERCTAQTTAGGKVYRCALEELHDGDHAFSEYAEADTGELIEGAPEPMSERNGDVEKLYKTVERSFTTYSARVDQLAAGAGLNLHVCPLCPSWHKGYVDLNDAGRLPQEVVGEVQSFLGFAREQEYEQASNIEPCAQCKGKGKVKTGSRVAGNESVTCRNCHGYGYYPPPTTLEAEGPGANVVHFPAGERPEPVAGGDTDISGEPRVLPDGRPNPNFGMWPQYKIQVPPYGTTAGLTAQHAELSTETGS